MGQIFLQIRAHSLLWEKNNYFKNLRTINQILHILHTPHVHPPIFSLCYTSFLSLPPIFFILPLFFYSCPLNFFFWASTTSFNLSNLFFVPWESCPHHVPGCPNILTSCYTKKNVFFWLFFPHLRVQILPPASGYRLNSQWSPSSNFLCTLNCTCTLFALLTFLAL